MYVFRTLLVALDGSHLAESVLPGATLFARRLDAQVILLHVLERDAPPKVHGEPHLTGVAEAEAYLENVAKELQAAGVTARAHVHPNPRADVAEGIAEQVRECEADLVVLATHGWGGLRDLLVGSIAQQVLKRVNVPVLLVKPTSEGEAPSFRGHRVLVPLSGTPVHDGAVLPLAGAVAAGLGAALTLVMVVPTRATLSAERSASAVLLPHASAKALDMKEEDAHTYLHNAVQTLEKEGARAKTVVLRGDPSTAVIQEAQESEADLIVMSTHAKGGWAAFWAGSVGPKILTRIEQPLLLVRVSGRK